MPKQEKIKSVMLTSSGEFRVSMVQTLNTLGFTAEKINADSMTTCAKLMQTDQLIWNVVVDAASFFPNETDLEPRFKEIEQAVGAAAVSVLVYVPAPMFEPLAGAIRKHPKLHVRPLPVRRQDVVDYFIKPYMARHGHGKVEKPALKAQQTASGESIAEATQHAKQTIDLLKKIAADPAAVPQFVAIGQRFNGLYGAYLFLGGKDGYHQLRILCEVIDALSKTYAKESSKKVLAKGHVELMVRCAKCVFGILKEMRTGKALSDDFKAETDAVRAAYEAQPDVFRREAMSQEFVDEILRKYSA